jgi:hypothetical protein
LRQFLEKGLTHYVASADLKKVYSLIKNLKSYLTSGVQFRDGRGGSSRGLACEVGCGLLESTSRVLGRICAPTRKVPFRLVQNAATTRSFQWQYGSLQTLKYFIHLFL